MKILGGFTSTVNELTKVVIALLGLAIAVATVGIPLSVVLTETPSVRQRIVPIVLESDGSKPSFPISLSRIGKSRSGDTSGK